MLDLHRQYGPIVRVSPGELSYCHPNAWKEIFDTRKKGVEWHDRDPAFFHSASHSISGATGYDQHVRHRQNISSAFSPQALVAQEPMFKQHVDLLIQCLKKECGEGKKAMNMASWYSWVTYDVIGKLMFSEDFDCLQSSTYRSWVTLISDSFRAGAWEAQLQYYPRPIAATLRYFFMPTALQSKFVQHGELTVEKLRKRLETTPESMDIIGVLQHRKRENEVCSAHCTVHKRSVLDLASGWANIVYFEQGASFVELLETAGSLLIAGSDSTATTLTAATYFLCSNRACLDKLAHEVRSSFESEGNMTLDRLLSLPYLQAVLEESLRMFPPAAGALPRQIGKSGEAFLGEYVPPKVCIHFSFSSFFSCSTQLTPGLD